VPEKTLLSANDNKAVGQSKLTMLASPLAIFALRLPVPTLTRCRVGHRLPREKMSSVEKFLAIMIQQPAFWIALSLFIPIFFVVLQWVFSEIFIVIRNFSSRSNKRPTNEVKRK
jgi:hypothetical protein